MALTKQVRGVHKSKEQSVANHATRQQDMPVCVDCRKVASPAIGGYDSKWRCLECNQLHVEYVLRESGNSAPNDSENRPGRPIAHDADVEANRKSRAARIMEKYGVQRHNIVWQ
jgi:hypothetical protein